ncbi:hypothetical protein [Gracilimonas tropica]|uniref:hypothetical protein n=1 Tax=Gracilimonas tropica TaxID=454600 RepID=UPI00036E99E5|nr:hypothetical protein [Gracilimonas tropica]
MNTPEKIKKNITQVETEIKDLEAKYSELEEKLFQKKKDAKAILSNEGEKEIQNLISHRQIVTEALEERREHLEELQQQLIQAEAKAARKNHFQTCVELAKQAEDAKCNYLEKVKELDNELYEKLLAVFDEKMKWKQAAETFMQTADKVAPGFKTTTKTDNDSEAEAERKTFIQQVEAEAGISTEAARTDFFLSYRFYRDTSPSGTKYKLDLKTPIASLAEKADLKRSREKEHKAKEVA